MYHDYGGDDGFVEFYEFDNVQEIYKYFDGMYPLCGDVIYGNGPFDLTDFFDCVIQTTTDLGTDDKKLMELLKQNNHEHDLTKFMRRKTDYSKSFENETRIIVQMNEKMKICNNHCQIKFKKPDSVCIPSSLDKKKAYTIHKICNMNKIEVKYIGDL